MTKDIFDNFSVCINVWTDFSCKIVANLLDHPNRQHSKSVQMYVLVKMSNFEINGRGLYIPHLNAVTDKK